MISISSEYTGTETVDDIPKEGVWETMPNGGKDFRGRIVTAAEYVEACPRLSGSSTLVMHGKLDPSLTGLIWGTFELVVPDSGDCQGGGVWQGTWAGKVSFSESYVFWHAVTQGVSGCVEGLMAKYDSEVYNPNTPDVPAPYSVTLLDPHDE